MSKPREFILLNQTCEWDLLRNLSKISFLIYSEFKKLINFYSPEIIEKPQISY